MKAPALLSLQLRIGEAFHPTEAPEEEVASAILPEKATLGWDPDEGDLI